MVADILQDAQTYAQENGLFFMETSAKTATNVNDIFYEIGNFFWVISERLLIKKTKTHFYLFTVFLYT